MVSLNDVMERIADRDRVEIERQYQKLRHKVELKENVWFRCSRCDKHWHALDRPALHVCSGAKQRVAGADYVIVDGVESRTHEIVGDYPLPTSAMDYAQSLQPREWNSRRKV